MENLTASPNPPCRTRKGPGRGAIFALAPTPRPVYELVSPVYLGGNFTARTQDAANQPRLFSDIPPPDARSAWKGADARRADARQGRLRLLQHGRRMSGAAGERNWTAAAVAVALLVVVRRRGGLLNGTRRIRARRRGGMLRMMNGGRGRRNDKADGSGARRIFACPAGGERRQWRRAVARPGSPRRHLAGAPRRALGG